MVDEFRPFNEDPGKTFKIRINLPHWRQQGATYFVTWRLGDSLPQGKLQIHEAARKAWLEAHGLHEPHEINNLPEAERHEYHARFTAELHHWLDAGHGSCVLREARCSRIVESALRHFDGQRHILDAFVVMPNHVHLLAAPHEDWPLSRLLHSWKSFTSHELSKLLGREGSLWQQESWDHIVRSEAQLEHYRRYISENPMRAKLREDEFILGRGIGISTQDGRGGK